MASPSPSSSPSEHPQQPSLAWRSASLATVSIIGSLSRIFLHVFSRSEIHNLPSFKALLDSRSDPTTRERGLLTISNHLSVVDDPLIWGVLPFSYQFNPQNHRWGLGAYDICFVNKGLSAFFASGQVLPTHRLRHSPYGGLFQPTMTQAVRLLSDPFAPSSTIPKMDEMDTMSSDVRKPDHSLNSPDLSDPFSEPHLTYSTNGLDTFPAPAAYPNRRYSWVHIFPEGMVHQHPHKTMRYFKWGVSRLILEPDVCPDIVPIWIEGIDQVMHEERAFPRFLPRPFRKLGIWFGDNVGGETRDNPFHELRARWQDLIKRESAKLGLGREPLSPGTLSDELKYGDEAVKLRLECTRLVREIVLDVRRKRGLPDEDPKSGLVETWRLEGSKREGRMKDGSVVKEM